MPGESAVNRASSRESILKRAFPGFSTAIKAVAASSEAMNSIRERNSISKILYSSLNSKLCFSIFTSILISRTGI